MTGTEGWGEEDSLYHSHYSTAYLLQLTLHPPLIHLVMYAFFKFQFVFRYGYALSIGVFIVFQYNVPTESFV